MTDDNLDVLSASTTQRDLRKHAGSFNAIQDRTRDNKKVNIWNLQLTHMVRPESVINTPINSSSKDKVYCDLSATTSRMKSIGKIKSFEVVVSILLPLKLVIVFYYERLVCL